MLSARLVRSDFDSARVPRLLDNSELREYIRVEGVYHRIGRCVLRSRLLMRGLGAVVSGVNIVEMLT